VGGPKAASWKAQRGPGPIRMGERLGSF
jgi:hypothetical protein